MELIKYRKGYNYQLAETYRTQTTLRPSKKIETEFITLDVDGVLEIRAGYAWDGATGAIDTNTIMRGSLVHDALYQLIRLGYLEKSDRSIADRELNRICLEDGMWKIRAKYVYDAVKDFADGAALPSSERQVYVAP